MFYRTVGVSRRVVRVKMKSKKGQKRAQTPARTENSPPPPRNSPSQISSSFEMRNEPRHYQAARQESSSNSDRKAVIAIAVVVALLVVGIYFARKSDNLTDGRIRSAPVPAKRDSSQALFLPGRADNSASGANAQASGGVAGMPLNLRPMGYSGSEARSFGHADALPGRGGASFSGSGNLGGRGGPMSLPGSSSEEIQEALNSSGSLKLTLPSEVSGKCDIGKSGVADLGICLAQAGARVERH